MDNKILVINRGSCSVGYSIPEMSVNRTFRPLGQPGDRMNISKEELKALNYTHGGRIIIEKYLINHKRTHSNAQPRKPLQYPSKKRPDFKND